MQPTWMVTGGAGFIGGNFVLDVIDRGRARVVNLDALTYAGNPDTLASLAGRDDHRFVHGSINDLPLLQRLLNEHQPQAIVHFAAESHVDRSIDGPADFVQTNVVGTLTLLQAALGYWQSLSGAAREQFRFLHVSTDEVFGSLGAEGRFHEETPYAPNSPYSASKAGSDHLVRAFHHTYGLPTLVTNCSNNYGPYQFPEKLIPLMIINGMEGKPLPVYGTGENVRDWLHVEDHARALALVVTKGRVGESYNIGGRNERSNLQVVETICDTLDALMPMNSGSRRELIAFVGDRPGHDMRYAIDATKIENELGWKARHNFDTGLKATIEWYLNNGDWWQPLRAGRYSGQRLGTVKA